MLGVPAMPEGTTLDYLEHYCWQPGTCPDVMQPCVTSMACRDSTSKASLQYGAVIPMHHLSKAMHDVQSERHLGTTKDGELT